MKLDGMAKLADRQTDRQRSRRTGREASRQQTGIRADIHSCRNTDIKTDCGQNNNNEYETDETVCQTADKTIITNIRQTKLYARQHKRNQAVDKLTPKTTTKSNSHSKY